MAFADYLPFYQAPVVRRAKRAKILDVEDQKGLVKIFKNASLALGFSGGTYTRRADFEFAPYDFDRIIQATDTDSYVKQAFNKYRELIWKEGWEIVGENADAVSYLYQRIDFMELAMKRPFQDLLNEIGDQLAKFSNCFVAKARGDLRPFYPGILKTPENKDPVIGYYVIPAETVEIKRDKYNKPMRYRQRLDDSMTDVFNGTNERYPSWAPDEIIHFTTDKKPGRAFGTPFMVAVMDDVVALRQIEEDIQNLIHRELFPLYLYKVGTEEHPAEDGEIDQAASELSNLRSEGGLVLPDRHTVEVLGAEGNALDISFPLTHFKERLAIGLGIYPHHLGMVANGGNRAMTDRLDVALYDKIKTYQRYLSGMVKLHVFNELLFEGGFDPVTSPMAEGVSDRCEFKFKEIDVDTQVKKETHEMQKFTNNLTQHDEARLAMGLDPESNEEDLLLGVQARLTPQQGGEEQPKISTKKGATHPGGGVPAPIGPAPKGKSGVPQKPDAQAPSTGGASNLPNTKRKLGNQVRPANQFGRRTSPNIRHADEMEHIYEVLDLLDEE